MIDVKELEQSLSIFRLKKGDKSVAKILFYRGSVVNQMLSISVHPVDGFQETIKVHQIFIKNLEIDPKIVKSATEVITAQNTLQAKKIEVETAREEAKRLELLASNSKNIEYMNANSLADIAAAVREGKVSSIVVPYDFKGIISVPTNR